MIRKVVIPAAGAIAWRKKNGDEAMISFPEHSNTFHLRHTQGNLA